MEDLWSTVQVWALWLWDQWQVKVLVAHIAINVIVAVAASIRCNEFVLAKTGEFLYRKVLPLVLTYAAFAFFGDAIDYGGVATAAWLLLTTILLGDLMDNLAKLGLPLPEGLTKTRL